jgi:hypothetical protein
VCGEVACKEEATGAEAGAGGGRDAAPKIRTPHKDVGKKDLSNKHWELK